MNLPFKNRKILLKKIILIFNFLFIGLITSKTSLVLAQVDLHADNINIENEIIKNCLDKKIDLFKIFNLVANQAHDLKEWKSGFNAYSLKNHPDKNKDNPHYQGESYSLVNNCWNTLKNGQEFENNITLYGELLKKNLRINMSGVEISSSTDAENPRQNHHFQHFQHFPQDTKQQPKNPTKLKQYFTSEPEINRKESMIDQWHTNAIDGFWETSRCLLPCLPCASWNKFYVKTFFPACGSGDQKNHCDDGHVLNVLAQVFCLSSCVIFHSVSNALAPLQFISTYPFMLKQNNSYQDICKMTVLLKGVILSSENEQSGSFTFEDFYDQRGPWCNQQNSQKTFEFNVVFSEFSEIINNLIISNEPTSFSKFSATKIKNAIKRVGKKIILAKRTLNYSEFQQEVLHSLTNSGQQNSNLPNMH